MFIHIFEQDSSIIQEKLDDVFKNRRSTLLILPAVDRQVIKIVIENPDSCMLAGGAALSLYNGNLNQIKDWDIFFPDNSSFRKIRAEFIRKGFNSTISTDWTETLEKSGVKVQLIFKHYVGHPSNLFRRFDFTVCCFALMGPHLYYTKEAKEDEAEKKFNFIYTDNSILTIQRIARYGLKGYTPTVECIKKILDNSTIPFDYEERARIGY